MPTSTPSIYDLYPQQSAIGTFQNLFSTEFRVIKSKNNTILNIEFDGILKIELFLRRLY